MGSHLLLLGICIGSLELFLGDGVLLLFLLLPGIFVVGKYRVLVSDHVLSDFRLALRIYLSLLLFALFPLPRDVLSSCCVFFTAFGDFVSKLRVFIGNFDLLLESQFFILQFSKAVFHHLGLWIIKQSVNFTR